MLYIAKDHICMAECFIYVTLVYICLPLVVARVSEEASAVDMTASPATSGENLGLFLLRKDSERRTTLHRILTEYITDVVHNIQNTLPQVERARDLGLYVSE